MSEEKNKNILKDVLQSEDAYTAKHSFRVAKITHILGKTLNLCAQEMEMLDEAAELHDIGKTRIDWRILNKPGHLTEEEFAEIKKHSGYGYDIAKSKNTYIANIILAHHERYDGSGYPNGISGREIPFLSRIIAVADSLDAMSSDRCYRGALPWSVCVSEIDNNNGKMYDPDVVHAFYICQDDIRKILFS